MRKMKKVAVLCLTAAMTMSLLAGCGGRRAYRFRAGDIAEKPAEIGRASCRERV